MAKEGKSIEKTLFACLAAWAIPGSGHMIFHKWGRGIILGLSVLTMFVLGLRMDGKLFIFDPSLPNPDFFMLLKFIADGSVGVLYILAKGEGWGVGDIRSFTHDYGNVFLYVAGLLNMLIILDVYDIGTGKKN